MYNEQYKHGFLKKIKRRDPYAVQFFQIIAPYEETLDKDISAFDSDELTTLFSEQFGIKEFPTYRAVELLRQYNRHCEHWKDMLKDPITKAWGKIEYDLIDEYRVTMYASPTHLAAVMDRCFSPLEEENVDILCRCFLWLSYAEIDDEKIIRLKRQDIDVTARIIRVGDREYPIIHEAYPSLVTACTIPAFQMVVRKGTTYIDRPHPAMLFSSMERDQFDPDGKLKAMRAKLSAASVQCGASFSYNQVRLSGMFYRVYTRERAMLVTSPEKEFVYFDMRGRRSDAGVQSLSVKDRRTENEMQIKYKAWKAAFAVD